MLDERSAGFVALGMAKASGRPVAVTCTSGTAAANLHPAVVEAWEARVPLIVLTADRPPELRDVGAGQAIDQIKLYGSAAKWFVEVGTHEPGRETAIHHRALACRAYWTAAGGRPGPVHLNFPLREPLAPVPEELEPARLGGARRTAALDRGARARERAARRRRARGRRAHRRRAARRDRVRARPASGSPRPAPALAARGGLAAARGADLGRALRRHDRSHVVAHYDVLLRIEDFAREHAPGLVLRVGDMPTSKPLRALVAEAPQIVVDPHGAWHEPTRTAELMLQAAAAPTLECAGGRGGDARREPASRAGSRLARAPTQGRAAARRGGARRLRGQGPREPRARAAGRGDRLGQLLDADPRRRGVLPAVAEAPALPGQPRRERDRRRRLLGAWAPRSPPASRPGC